MRKIDIIEETDRLRKWIAIDRLTRLELLRLHDLDQLENVCERLEWQVVEIICAAGHKDALKPQGRTGHKAAAARALRVTQHSTNDRRRVG